MKRDHGVKTVSRVCRTEVTKGTGAEERYNRTRETNKGGNYQNCLEEVGKHANTSKRGKDSIDRD